MYILYPWIRVTIWAYGLPNQHAHFSTVGLCFASKTRSVPLHWYQMEVTGSNPRPSTFAPKGGSRCLGAGQTLSRRAVPAPPWAARGHPADVSNDESDLRLARTLRTWRGKSVRDRRVTPCKDLRVYIYRVYLYAI